MNEGNIGDLEATALAEGLTTNTTMTTLILSRNKIGFQGAAALAKQLDGDTALTSLDLNVNRIPDQGVTALAEALETNRTLTTVELGGFGFGSRSKITQFMARNCFLARLNPILAQFLSAKTCIEIVDVLKAHNDDVSILFPLLKARNEWIKGGNARLDNKTLE